MICDEYQQEMTALADVRIARETKKRDKMALRGIHRFQTCEASVEDTGWMKEYSEYLYKLLHTKPKNVIHWKRLLEYRLHKYRRAQAFVRTIRKTKIHFMIEDAAKLCYHRKSQYERTKDRFVSADLADLLGLSVFSEQLKRE